MGVTFLQIYPGIEKPKPKLLYVTTEIKLPILVAPSVT